MVAIQTLNGLLAGMQQPVPYAKVGQSGTYTVARWYSQWPLAGVPGAGTYSGSAGGAALSSTGGLVTGQIPHTDPGAGLSAYLARVAMFTSSSGCLLVCDRLWHNGGLSATSTSPQTVNSVAFPARDQNGQTNGLGVMIGVELSAASTGNGTSISVSYTNSAGVASRTATNYDPTYSSPPQGGFFRLFLQAGDQGVQSIQTVTWGSTWTTGTFNLVAYRVLAAMATVAGVGISENVQSLALPQLFNGTVPYLMFTPNVTGNMGISGTYTETQG